MISIETCLNKTFISTTSGKNGYPKFMTAIEPYIGFCEMEEEYMIFEDHHCRKHTYSLAAIEKSLDGGLLYELGKEEILQDVLTVLNIS